MRRASRCKALWGDSVETMDVGAGHPFCGESLQQRVSAVCPTYAIIGDQARPPPISFDVGGGGGRVSRVQESVTQGVEFATSNAAAGPRVTRGPVAFGSGSATFSRDQGRKPWRFSLALCRAPVRADDPSEPALRPRVSTTRRPQPHPHIWHLSLLSSSGYRSNSSSAAHTRRLDSTIDHPPGNHA
jgi:hypothetical protein